ncbi:hypothetical protein SLS57_009125 [Botryosphaeria dothidea]
MSQHMLPHTVRIKRKRQDEPVETLHVHTHDDPKKRRFNVEQSAPSYPAVFRRVLEEPGASASASIPSPATAPTATPAGATGLGDPASRGATSTPTAPASSSGPSSSLSIDRKILAPFPVTRRFHLSTKSVSSPSLPAGGVQKRKNVATLVESKPKKTRTGAGASNLAQKTIERHSNDVEMQIDQPLSERPLKRPGRTARSASPAVESIQPANKNGADTPIQSQPSSKEATNKTNAMDSKKNPAVDPGLLTEMQKFAQEVEHAEQKSPAPANRTAYWRQQQQQQPPPPPTVTPHTPQKHLKFQPKATPRFRDRHPERFANQKSATEMDVDDESDSDGEYVYDTYVRYDGPPDTVIEVDPLTATSLPPDIGVLIISAEDQPLWEAYMEPGAAEGASDKEFDTDDEDENAEDFYANEYPEDEVASGDERDEDAYRYRVNASDEEEYGLYSDEEDLSRPWGRRPAWLKNASGEDNDED